MSFLHPTHEHEYFHSLPVWTCGSAGPAWIVPSSRIPLPHPAPESDKTWRKEKGQEEVKLKADGLCSCLCQLLSYCSLLYGQKEFHLHLPRLLPSALGQLS